MARILGIGVATLDIINEVAAYPVEDTESRALAQRHARGGNAANTLTVLSALGHHCKFGGVLAGDPAAAWVRADLEARGIDCSACPVESAGVTPTSCVLLNIRSGSRTIVHHRRLREFGFDDFEPLVQPSIEWIHFEGRNPSELRRMLELCETRGLGEHTSLEVEKPRAGIEQLFAGPRCLFFSRVYASARGFEDPLVFLRHVHPVAPRARLVCAWGAAGAYALDPDGGECHCPAFPPPVVRDTLGAGDTFVAGVIDALIADADLRAAVEAGSRLAGRKCGQPGFDGLVPPRGRGSGGGL